MESLEELIRDAVIVGGKEVMKHYGKATALGTDYAASTNADDESTVAIINHLETSNDAFFYFSEEFGKLKKPSGEYLEGRLKSFPSKIRERFIPSYATFLQSLRERKGLHVLFDPLDGTNAYRSQLPYFATAAAIYINGKLTIGAIYLPAEDIAYYGSISPEGNSAKVYDVVNRVVKDLVEERKNILNGRGKQKPQVVYQYTRSDLSKREQGLKFLTNFEQDATVYMINSGQYALAKVTRGSFDGYGNNYTYAWDIAAGDVLVRAIGGKITGFGYNAEVGYDNSNGRVGILAAGDEETYQKIFSKPLSLF